MTLQHWILVAEKIISLALTEIHPQQYIPDAENYCGISLLYPKIISSLIKAKQSDI